jgi:hypothetical protein
MSNCFQITLLAASGHVKAVFRSTNAPWVKDTYVTFYSLLTEKEVRIYKGDGDSLIVENISAEMPAPVEKYGVQMPPRSA